MNETNPINPTLGDRLLQQDSALQSSQYKEHRMQLEQKLERARRWERRLTWAVPCALLLAIGLLPISGGKVFGPADPTETGANWISVSLGAIQVLATIFFWIGLGTYFSRIRPALRQSADQLRDQAIQEILSEVRRLRLDVDMLSQDRRQRP